MTERLAALATGPQPALEHSTVPIHWIAAIARAGGDVAAHVDPALRAAGLDRRLLDDTDALAPARAECAFVEALAQASGDALLGLKLGLAMNPHRTSLLGYLFVNAATVGEALAAVTRYLRVVRPASLAAIATTPAGARLTLDHVDPVIPRSRQHAEFVVGAVAAACRLCGGPHAGPTAVAFAHRPGPMAQAVAAQLGARVDYDAPTIAMDLPARALAAPIPSADLKLHRLLTDHAEQLLAAAPLPADSAAARLARLAVGRLAQGAPTAAEAAHALGLSPRTLARRLAQEGATYRQVLDRLRRDLARRYLADRSIPLAEVAFLLGFADQSAFTTAHRRWTGASPGAWRAALGG